MNTTLIQEFMPYVVVILTLAILGYTLWKDRQPIELDEIPAQLAVAKSEAEELAQVSLTATQAAEQLWRSGKITRDDRWYEAVAYVRRFFPDVDAEVLAKNLEAAVLIVNSVTNSLPKKEDTP